MGVTPGYAGVAISARDTQTTPTGYGSQVERSETYRSSKKILKKYHPSPDKRMPNTPIYNGSESLDRARHRRETVEQLTSDSSWTPHASGKDFIVFFFSLLREREQSIYPKVVSAERGILQVWIVMPGANDFRIYSMISLAGNHTVLSLV